MYIFFDILSQHIYNYLYIKILQAGIFEKFCIKKRSLSRGALDVITTKVVILDL